MFEWADSYDHKDWARLSKILAPTLHVDYTKIGKPCWPEMPVADYLAMMSSDLFLGDTLIRTQHLLGATRWEKLSETSVIGHHQLRAAHQVYSGEGPDEGDGFNLKGLGRVAFQGHSHASNEHYYEKVNGVWKFAGLKPEVLWNEGFFEKVFKGSYVEENKAANGNGNGHAVKEDKMQALKSENASLSSESNGLHA